MKVRRSGLLVINDFKSPGESEGEGETNRRYGGGWGGMVEGNFV